MLWLMGASLLNLYAQIQDDVFSLKFSTQICEFILNLHMKCETALHLWGKRDPATNRKGAWAFDIRETVHR